ncbi:MAG: hypothetical protein NTV23_07110 [Propionibacteriales bacterium]|nr:hypothetical protein [Propionibacteriales bacterium]
MKLARALALATLGCALLVPVTASVAQSASLPNRATTTDTTGDIVFVRVAGDQVLPGGAAKKRTMGDIRTVQVTHTKTAIRVFIKYVELNRVGVDHFHVVQFRTPTRSYEVDLYATTRAWRGDPALYTASGSSPRCTLAWKLDYDLNTALISVPRSCVGNPTWIRAGAGMSNTYGDKRYADDGLTAQPAGRTLTLGPRLYS